jgi:hypothetical protein
MSDKLSARKQRSKERRKSVPNSNQNDEDGAGCFISPLPTDDEADRDDIMDGEGNNPFSDLLPYLPKRCRDHIMARTGDPVLEYVIKADWEDCKAQMKENEGRTNYTFRDLYNMPDYVENDQTWGHCVTVETEDTNSLSSRPDYRAWKEADEDVLESGGYSSWISRRRQQEQTKLTLDICFSVLHRCGRVCA